HGSPHWCSPNLFQPAAGIHTSNLMSESVVGLTVAATRQNAGTFLYEAGIGSAGGLGGVHAPAAAGRVCEDAEIGVAGAWAGVNAPAATELATVIVVFGSLRLVRLSHVAAMDDEGPIRRTRMIACRIRTSLRRA